MNKNDIAFGKNATPESLAKQAVDIAEMVTKQAPKAKTASTTLDSRFRLNYR